MVDTDSPADSIVGPSDDQDRSAEAGASAPAYRRDERVSAGSAPRVDTRRGAAGALAFQPLESSDSGIPFDRVPYVPADLRRVAVIAVAMIVLIVVAAAVVSQTIH